MPSNQFSPARDSHPTMPAQERRLLARAWLPSLAVLCAAGCGDPSSVPNGAALDVHLHIASPALTDAYAGPGTPVPTASGLIALMDEAHVRKGIILSAGYLAFDDDSNMGPENDYVASEVARYPDRLIGFCGINPRYASAPDEVTRCLKLPGMKGIKLHLTGSAIELDDPTQVEALDAVFDRIAESGNPPVLMHAGNSHAQPLTDAAFQNLSTIIKAHPQVRVTHAHCAGNTDDAGIEQWLRVPGAGYNENSFVDTSACLKFYRDAPLATRELMVWRFRKWGIERVLLGSDYIQFQPEETPAEAIETLKRYPFTDDELKTILDNDGGRWLNGPSVEVR